MCSLNPCLRCDHLKDDKNTPICRQCQKRLHYLRQIADDLQFCAISESNPNYVIQLPRR